MIHHTDKKQCCGCSACFATCPDNCIMMKPDQEGFEYPIVDHDRCRHCRQCQNVCPIIHPREQSIKPEVCACFNKDESLRMRSTSGGIFSLLAEHVLDQCGVVFGAMFNEQWDVIHRETESREELHLLNGSKYVQSRMNDCYHKVQLLLDQGRPVLFSGTSCQIAGLQAYLQREDENLLCVGIVCHSVPSPKVFRKYRDGLQRWYGQEIQGIEFRKKLPFWRSSRIAVQLERDRCEESVYENIYTRGFFAGLYSRPSCHCCQFKYGSMNADIVLGDFWGVEHVLPEMDDNRGTSMVLVYTEKGKRAFNQTTNRMTFQEADLQSSVKYNPYLVRSVVSHPNREAFFQELDRWTGDLNTLIEKHLGKKEKE